MGTGPAFTKVGRKHLFAKEAVREWLSSDRRDGHSPILKFRTYLYASGFFGDILSGDKADLTMSLPESN